MLSGALFVGSIQLVGSFIVNTPYDSGIPLLHIPNRLENVCLQKKLYKNVHRGTRLHCWWECQLVQPLWKTVWMFLKKLKIELPYDPGIPLLDIYPDKTIIQKDMCTPMFIAAIFTRAKTQKQPKCPSTDEWIKKMWYIYTMEYYSAIEKNEIMPFEATWMQVEIIILSEVSQKEKDKYHMISLICGI